MASGAQPWIRDQRCIRMFVLSCTNPVSAPFIGLLFRNPVKLLFLIILPSHKTRSVMAAWGWVQGRILPGCLCSSSRLFSIIHGAVWQPAFRFPLRVHDPRGQVHQSPSRSIRRVKPECLYMTTFKIHVWISCFTLYKNGAIVKNVSDCKGEPVDWSQYRYTEALGCGICAAACFPVWTAFTLRSGIDNVGAGWYLDKAEVCSAELAWEAVIFGSEFSLQC